MTRLDIIIIMWLYSALLCPNFGVHMIIISHTVPLKGNLTLETQDSNILSLESWALSLQSGMYSEYSRLKRSGLNDQFVDFTGTRIHAL